MYSKSIYHDGNIVGLEIISRQVFECLYAQEIKQLEKENPKQLQRVNAHYAFWWENINFLKNYNDDSLPEARRGIFKIFTEVDEVEGKKFLIKLQTTFEKHEIFMILTMIFHDLGKFVNDPEHSEISFMKFQELNVNNFHGLADTEVYEYMMKMPEESRYIMGLLIKYHTVGSITYDGNLGMLRKLKEDYRQVTGLPWGEFLYILICFVALDKASVANSTNDGFLGWYDITRLQHMLKSSYEVGTLGAWADMVTNQFIMNHAYKQAAYDFYYPKFEEVANVYFDHMEKSFLRQMNYSLAQATDMGYINNHLIHFAWEGQEEVLKKEIAKNEDFFVDMNILMKFFLIKTAITFFYEQEKTTLNGITFYGYYDKMKEKDVFVLREKTELYLAMHDYIEKGKTARILRLPGADQQ